jgi:hypothetical protein
MKAVPTPIPTPIPIVKDFCTVVSAYLRLSYPAVTIVGSERILAHVKAALSSTAFDDTFAAAAVLLLLWKYCKPRISQPHKSLPDLCPWPFTGSKNIRGESSVSTNEDMSSTAVPTTFFFVLFDAAVVAVFAESPEYTVILINDTCLCGSSDIHQSNTCHRKIKCPVLLELVIKN